MNFPQMARYKWWRARETPAGFLPRRVKSTHTQQARDSSAGRTPQHVTPPVGRARVSMGEKHAERQQGHAHGRHLRRHLLMSEQLRADATGCTNPQSLASWGRLSIPVVPAARGSSLLKPWHRRTWQAGLLGLKPRRKLPRCYQRTPGRTRVAPTHRRARWHDRPTCRAQGHASVLWARYGRDMGEIWAGYGRDMGEIWASLMHTSVLWARYGRDMGEIWASRMHKGTRVFSGRMHASLAPLVHLTRLQETCCPV